MDEKEDIKIKITEIKRTKTYYYEQLYFNKLSILEKNAQLSGNIQQTKSESRKNRKSEQTSNM